MMSKTIILVQPEIPENTGFIARLCSNYNYDLRVVDPEFNLSECRDTAANAQDVLDNAEIFPTLEESIEDLDFVVGTKPGRGVSASDFQPRENTSIVLGREGSGLSNEELDMCDAVVHLDVPGYRSLNLSHAAGILMDNFREREEGKNFEGRRNYLESLVGDNIISELLMRGSPTEDEFDRLIGELKKWKED